MTDVRAFVEIDDFLGNVSGVVRNSFEAFGNHHQIERACGGGRVFNDKTD